MTPEALFDLLGDVDEDYVAQARQPAPARPRLRWAAAAACLVLVGAAGLHALWGGGEAIPLSAASSGVTARYGEPAFAFSSSADLAPLTEEELFTQFDTAVFQGTVEQVDNIVLDFNGSENYRALARISVEEVYRGPCRAGDTVTVLLPCPILEGFWVEDTEVVSAMAPGVRGIFMPMVYDETSVREENGATLALLDVARYGFADGSRYAFLETEEGLLYAQWAYPSLAGAESLDQVEAFVTDMIAKTAG